MQDDVVETPDETTSPTESTPVETETTESTEEAPVDESIDSEQVSKHVPYERFQEVNSQVKELKEMVAAMYQRPQAQEPQYQPDVPQLDPDAEAAVDYRISQKANEIIAQQRVAEFQAKHANELKKDPILQATVEAQMRKQNAEGQPIMPEKAFEDAKQLIESRMKVKADVAKTEGIKEGQDIAKTKQQLAAVGETGKQIDKSDDQLSATEFAQKYNIPRSAGY